MQEDKQEQILNKLDQLLSQNQGNEAIVSAVNAMRSQIQNEDAPDKNVAESQAAVEKPPATAVDPEELQRKSSLKFSQLVFFFLFLR